MKAKAFERQVLFYMPDELKTELHIQARREGRTVKDIINELVGKYLEVHKDGNPQHLITKFQENEDFVGFPAIAIDYQAKKDYIANVCCDKPRTLSLFGQELLNHVNQWHLELMKN